MFLIEGAVVLELVGEVENDIGLEALELLAQQIEIIEDGEVLRGVAELVERGEDVCLGLPVVGLQLGAQVLVERRGRDGVEEGEDFEFFLHGLFRAFESAGEEVVHHQRGDVGGDLEILLRLIGLDVQGEFVAAVDQARQQLVDGVFFLVRPLADGAHQLPPALSQVGGGFHPAGRIRFNGEELLQIVVVEVRVAVLVELALPGVVGLELDVEAVQVGDAVGGLMRRRFPGEGTHQFVDVLQLMQGLPAL